MADTPVQGVPTPQDLKTEQSGQTPEAVDPRLAAFAQKERQIRKMQQEMQAEKARMQEEALKYQTDYLPKSRLAEDPLSVLSEMGYDTEKLSQLLLNAPNANDPTVRMFQNKIKALEDKQAAAEQRAVEATKQQFEQAKKQIANEAKMLVDGNADYETIKSAGMHDAVTELILQTFEKTGVLMDVTDACQQVEEHLVNEGLKFAQMGKVQKKMQPPAAQTQPGQSQQNQLKTITQNMTQPASGKSMTAAERRARAVAAFNGQLKS